MIARRLTQLYHWLRGRRVVKRVPLTHGELVRYNDGTIAFNDDGKYDMPAIFVVFRNGLDEGDEALAEVRRS